jgi:hypothetical protein
VPLELSQTTATSSSYVPAPLCWYMDQLLAEARHCDTVPCCRKRKQNRHLPAPPLGPCCYHRDMAGGRVVQRSFRKERGGCLTAGARPDYVPAIHSASIHENEDSNTVDASHGAITFLCLPLRSYAVACVQAHRGDCGADEAVPQAGIPALPPTHWRWKPRRAHSG